MAETQNKQNRNWLVVGGVIGFVLLCVAGLFFVASQYRNAMTAYAWIQDANSTSADLNEMLCEDAAQARRFNVAFNNRYGTGARIDINLSEFEQEDDHVRFVGDIVFEDDTQDFEAVFHLGDGDGNGFLGLLGCIDRIEQIQPDTIPQQFWGR
jgi:hypothetical protein